MSEEEKSRHQRHRLTVLITIGLVVLSLMGVSYWFLYEHLIPLELTSGTARFWFWGVFFAITGATCVFGAIRTSLSLPDT